MSRHEASILGELTEVFADVKGVEEASRISRKALDEGILPVKIIEAMREGLGIAGQRYSSGQYFLSELIMAGVMASEVSNLIKPCLESSTERSFGKIVIGTVEGDLHDIGKNIVATMLLSTGFEVSDLGVDVSVDAFGEAVKRTHPDILALSCLLTIAMDQMKRVIDSLAEHRLRGEVKILVGGRPIDEQFATLIGADGYGEDAVQAMQIAKRLVKK